MKRSKAIIEGHPDGRDAYHQAFSHALKVGWPTEGAPLAANVQPPGFLPVTEEILAEIVRRLVVALDPEKIILFGAYVYGSPSGDSDVDMLVIMQTTARPADRYVAVSRVIRPRPFPLDLLVKTPDEIAGALAKGDNFIQEIVTRGRVLYAQHAGAATAGGIGTQFPPLGKDALRMRTNIDHRDDLSLSVDSIPQSIAGWQIILPNAR
jgi:uncharacterized protein